jgi:hypothetical protein
MGADSTATGTRRADFANEPRNDAREQHLTNTTRICDFSIHIYSMRKYDTHNWMCLHAFWHELASLHVMSHRGLPRQAVQSGYCTRFKLRVSPKPIPH